MPGSEEGPQPQLSESVFDDLRGWTYVSSEGAYKDGSGDRHYIHEVRGVPRNKVKWFLHTDSDGASWIPQAAADVIGGGSWNGAKNAVEYNGSTYVFENKWNDDRREFTAVLY